MSLSVMRYSKYSEYSLVIILYVSSVKKANVFWGGQHSVKTSTYSLFLVYLHEAILGSFGFCKDACFNEISILCE